MSSVRDVNGQDIFKQERNALESARRNRRENVISRLQWKLSTRNHIYAITGVIDHMNTKMILAALALSLSLAACAKKDEAQDAAAAAGDAAQAAGEAAGDAAAAAGDAAASAATATGDAAAEAAGDAAAAAGDAAAAAGDAAQAAGEAAQETTTPAQ